MPIRLRGVVLSTDGWTPQNGVAVEAYDPSSGIATGSATSNLLGDFILTDLPDRAWVARPVSPASNVYIQVVTETCVDDTAHGRRSTQNAHRFVDLAERPDIVMFYAANYDITGQTSWTIFATEHRIYRTTLDVLCQSRAGGIRTRFRPDTVSVEEATYDVTVTFGEPVGDIRMTVFG